MKRYWMFRKGKFLLWAVVAISIFGLVVMGLWNWLMPALFGWNEIGFLQAVGLLILSKILFGGFRGPWGYGMQWRQRMKKRWERMTPEEREKFRAGFRGRCGARSETTNSRVQAD